MSIVHGALDHSELEMLGLRSAEVLDFSSNVNPFGPPPGVRSALATLDPAPYPDRSCYRLRRLLAARHACAPQHVLVGNGSVELIHLIAWAVLRPGDKVLVVEPTFGEYAHASQLAGAEVIRWRADAQQGFMVDMPAITRLIEHTRPRIVWVCTPNNPTGVALSSAEITALAAAYEATNGVLVVDCAYADMQRGCDSPVPGLELMPHVIQLFSLTKLYALAGLRLGYMLADAVMIEKVSVYQPAWSVNSAAQTAGLAALADGDFVTATLPRLWQCSDQLRKGLENLGLEVWRAALPFMLVRTGDAVRTRARLLKQGCLVRDCTSFGLPQYVRVAPRAEGDNDHLIATWRGACPHQS